MKQFSIIVAFDDKQGIGKNNALPWKLSSDLKHFKEITTSVHDRSKKNAVIMGRKTWDSLPARSKPLQGRMNIVLTRQKELGLAEGVFSYSDLSSALEDLSNHRGIESVFVIGGADLYAQTIVHPQCRRIIATAVQGDFVCDAFFPIIPSRFREVSHGQWLRENNITFRFVNFLS